MIGTDVAEKNRAWQEQCERAAWQLCANSGRKPPTCSECGRALGFGGVHIGGPCRARTEPAQFCRCMIAHPHMRPHTDRDFDRSIPAEKARCVRCGKPRRLQDEQPVE